MSIPLLFAKRRFSPRRLFAAGEQGSVHIARDLDTLISTAAGSTPDVSLNGYAGQWLDQSGLGNHATQSTSTARPQLSARLNLIPSYTEQFEQSVWQKTLAGTGSIPVVTANAGADPLGGNTADRIQMARTGTGTLDRSMIARTFNGVAALNTSYTYKVWLKSYDNTNQTIALVANWSLPVASTVVTATDAWQQFSVANNTGSISNLAIAFGFYVATMAETAADILAWGIDLRRTTDFDAYSAYQRVVSATDYDSAGFPLFLSFDSDDALVATYPSSLGSNCTVCIGRAATTPLILTGQTIGTSYTLNAAVADRVTGLIVVNRALTALETAQVTAYLQARS